LRPIAPSIAVSLAQNVGYFCNFQETAQS
jgi:hypothetical protein